VRIAARILHWNVVVVSLLLVMGHVAAQGNAGEPSREGRSSAGGAAFSVAADEEPKEAPDEQPGGAPRIEFDELAHDFGSVYQYGEVSHSFAFRNTGTAMLVIGKVRSTCGCTPAVAGKSEIPPGDVGEIDVTFRSGSRRGRFAKHVYVSSNDPANPRIDLTVSGEVKVEVDVTPRGIYIGKMKVGQTLERWVELTAVEVPSFSILGVRTTHPALTALKPIKLPGKPCRYRLAIRFGPATEPGRVSAEVILRTDLPHTRELTISVYGKVTDGAEPARPTGPA